MIPKVDFKYFFQYDERYRHFPAMKVFLKERNKKYPAPENIIKKFQEITK